MRYILAFVVGIVLGSCVACSPGPAPRAPVDHVAEATALERKTVGILVGEHICAGVWIGEHEIVTADHCVEDLAVGTLAPYVTREDVFPWRGFAREMPSPTDRRSAFVARHDAKHDLALLLAPDAPPGHGVAVIRTEPVEPGMWCQAMGHPIGLWFSYSSGDVAALRERIIDGKLVAWVQSTAPISHGSSGGGLFDSDGALIGIAVAMGDGGTDVGLFTPSLYVARLLHPVTP